MIASSIAALIGGSFVAAMVSIFGHDIPQAAQIAIIVPWCAIVGWFCGNFVR